MGPTIAVIIPTCNRYRYLREAIASVLSQTRRADEIVVVDDGSTDETALAAQEFPTITYYRTENAGLSAARNFGTARTRAEFLVYLDDDDRLASDALELQELAFARQPHLGLVYGRAYLIDAEGRRIGEHLRNHRPARDLLGALLVENFVLIQTVMVRRRVVECVGGFRGFQGEDLDLYLRLITANIHFGFVDRCLAEFRKTPGTMSANKLEHALGTLAAVERNLALFPQVRSNLYYTAFYHYRVGRAFLECGSYPQARREFLLALRGRCFQPHFWIYWLAASFPRICRGPLHQAQRAKRACSEILVQLGWREKRWGTPSA